MYTLRMDHVRKNIEAECILEKSKNRQCPYEIPVLPIHSSIDVLTSGQSIADTRNDPELQYNVI